MQTKKQHGTIRWGRRLSGPDTQRLPLRGFAAAVRMALLAVFATLVISACGGSGSARGTSYWRETFTDGSSNYLSLTVAGDNVAGWAKYGDGTWSRFVGTKGSDGTLSITAYSGSTLSVNGDTMSGTDGGGSREGWDKTTEADYTAAGGPAAAG